MRPIKILSYANLLAAWRHSRDYSHRPGAPGIDSVTAEEFKKNSSQNLTRIFEQIRRGEYNPSSLRLALIPKGTSDYRAVAIPNISDRVVQRAINNYLMGPTVNLRLQKDYSYGFIRNFGTSSDAVNAAIGHRRNQRWVVKTDISSFFDNINRTDMMMKLPTIRMSPSIGPELIKIINLEVRIKSNFEKEKFKKSGLVRSVGLRQGMPLSPLLSSIYLRDFDKSIRRLNIDLIRYADDIVIFGNSEKEVISRFRKVRLELEKNNLSVPELGTSKSQLSSPNEPIEYLGQEIYWDGHEKYKVRIPKKSITRILNEIGETTLAKEIAKKSSMGRVFQRLDLQHKAYDSYYCDATNLRSLQQQIGDQVQIAKKQIVNDLFGESAWTNLTAEKKRFLGWHD